ncbi:cold-shock protein [Paenibacillus sp. GCM10023252]|uniref:cold-shock protein n=1 Tax=Paenibacillus sp. GCM10023252 TaxID=3252649 RepID=UPI003614CAE3
MYYRKRSLEDIPEENTNIWSCSQEECNGWIRDDFAFKYVPTCGFCHSTMVSSTRMLPTLVNTNKDMKSLKMGTIITE